LGLAGAILALTIGYFIIRLSNHERSE
jgi:hypothetical protein